MLWEKVPLTSGRDRGGRNAISIEGGCGRADANGDNFDMVTISFVSLFGDVCERALSERCVNLTYYVYLILVMTVVF